MLVMHDRKSKTRAAIIPVLDCHLHGPAEDGSVFQWTPMLSNYRDYLDFLHTSGIHGGIQSSITAVLAKTASQLAAGNRCALKLARPAVSRPLQIMPACIVHPSFLAQARRDLKTFRKAGSCWVGEVCPYLSGWTAAHPRFKTMLRLLESENVVLQIHHQTDAIHRMIAETAPRLTLVISHLGGKAEIEELLALAADYPNIILDICGSGYDRLGMLEKGVAMGLEDRILYGSDFPVNDPGAVRTRILNGWFTPAVKRKILGKNLQRLLATKGIHFW